MQAWCTRLFDKASGSHTAADPGNGPARALPFSLPPILFLTAIFYVTFVTRLVLAPLLPVLEHELGLGHGQAGALFLAIAIGYAGGLLGSGVLSARLTHRRTIAISAAGVGLSLLFIVVSESIVALRMGLVLLGLSAGLYLPSGVAAITDEVDEPHWGKALGIHEFAPNLGYVTAPLLIEVLLRFVSWRGALAILGVLAIALGILYQVWGSGGSGRGEPPRLDTIWRLAHDRSLWIMSALFAVATGAGVGIYMMMPLFLVQEIHLPRALANTLIGLSRLSGVVMVFVSGFLTDRIGHRRALTVCLTATGVLTLALGRFRGPALTPVLLFLQSTASVCFYPAAFSLVSLLVPPRVRSLAVSLVLTIGFLLGAGVTPTGIGYFAEAYSFAAAFCLVGAATLLPVPLLFRIKESAKRERIA